MIHKQIYCMYKKKLFFKTNKGIDTPVLTYFFLLTSFFFLFSFTLLFVCSYHHLHFVLCGRSYIHTYISTFLCVHYMELYVIGYTCLVLGIGITTKPWEGIFVQRCS